MARIIPIQTKITLQLTPDAAGSYYPACVFSNDTFLGYFETSLLTTKQLLEPDTELYATTESVLTGLSEYRVWKYNKQKTETPLPNEITEHFALLPEGSCNIDMPFQPYNNVPTDAILYSYEEVNYIVNAMAEALKKADKEQAEAINPIYESLNSFLTAWNENQAQTGSYFANEKII